MIYDIRTTRLIFKLPQLLAEKFTIILSSFLLETAVILIETNLVYTIFILCNNVVFFQNSTVSWSKIVTQNGHEMLH